MLPSTGYFKAINCPFYESGTCDRPYCHFKHSKRGKSCCCLIFNVLYFSTNLFSFEYQNFFHKRYQKKKKVSIIILEDVGITTEAIEAVENRSTGQVEESKSATMVIFDFYLEFYNKNYKKLSKNIITNRNFTQIQIINFLARMLFLRQSKDQTQR